MWLAFKDWWQAAVGHTAVIDEISVSIVVFQNDEQRVSIVFSDLASGMKIYNVMLSDLDLCLCIDQEEVMLLYAREAKKVQKNSYKNWR